MATAPDLQNPPGGPEVSFPLPSAQEMEDLKSLNPTDWAKKYWLASQNLVAERTVQSKPKLYKTKRKHTKTYHELWTKKPDNTNSLYWCLADHCEVVLEFNYSELSPLLQTEKPEWPKGVQAKIEILPSEVKTRWFPTMVIPPDVIGLLELYPASGEALQSDGVFYKLVVQSLPEVLEHLKTKAPSWSTWVLDSVSWLAKHAAKATLFLIRNPLLTSFLLLMSKTLRMVACVYFSNLSPEDIQKVLAGLFSNVGSSNPILVVVSFFVSCLFNVAKTLLSGNFVGLGTALADCATALVKKVANLGGLVRMFTDFLLGWLQLIGKALDVVGPLGSVLRSVVKGLQILLNCSGSPLTCVGSVFTDSLAQELSLNLVVSSHLGLQLSTFSLLMLLDLMGEGVEGIIRTYVPIPQLRKLMEYLEKRGIPFSKWIGWSATLAVKGVDYPFRVVWDVLQEVLGWVEFFWGCGLKRLLDKLSQLLGLSSEVPGEETQIACCMATIVQELREATQVQSTVSSVKSMLWNWLPCDARHKTFLLTSPVATVRHGRKTIKFYAFVWNADAPYACQQLVHVAPLAQQIRRQFPRAVRRHPKGYGWLINFKACPKVVQRACRYFRSPVISLEDDCPVVELRGGDPLF